MAASDPPRGTTRRPDAPVPWARRSLLLALVVLFGWAVVSSGIPVERILRAPEGIWRIARLMVPPDWAYIGRALEGMVESVHIAWFGTVIGATLSLPLALLAAKNVTGQATSTAARQVLNGFRAVPELVLAVVFVAMIGLGAVPGALAIGIHSIGTLGKLASEAIESIDRGPLEAADAVGASWLQKMRWGVLPQALPEIVAFWLYRFEINIRASAILGVIGAGGVGAVLSNTVSYRRWDKAGMTLIVVVVVTLLIDAISGRIRRRIISGGDKPAEVAEGDMILQAGA
ncbi:MAG: phosphonate ABC transporter, permease protein PhnE [Actinobacteria bacterium]|nr:phosphonate ABC transporter, permease protein PhnE [Actinomycetota bacterium]